jgi:hypothetical protein
MRRYVPTADYCTAAKEPLFDHLVGADKESGWHGETECSGGFQVDDQLDLR